MHIIHTSTHPAHVKLLPKTSKIHTLSMLVTVMTKPIASCRIYSNGYDLATYKISYAYLQHFISYRYGIRISCPLGYTLKMETEGSSETQKLSTRLYSVTFKYLKISTSEVAMSHFNSCHKLEHIS